MVVFFKTFLFEKLFKLEISVAKLKRLSKEKSGKIHFFYISPREIRKMPVSPLETTLFAVFQRGKADLLSEKVLFTRSFTSRKLCFSREKPMFLTLFDVFPL